MTEQLTEAQRDKLREAIAIGKRGIKLAGEIRQMIEHIAQSDKGGTPGDRTST